jgi:glyoxylase-like metal-dependent hydrolase (beta-lactamase superfamily II)
VVTTHSHPDHWQGLEDVVEATGARSLAHAADARDLPVVDETLRDGDTVSVGTCALEVIHLVGHTPGSIALLYQDPSGHPHLFTGDSLFPGGVGNTDKDPKRFASLFGDVTRKLFDRLPDDTWFYPGHGKDSTLGAERPHLEEWRARGW